MTRPIKAYAFISACPYKILWPYKGLHTSSHKKRANQIESIFKLEPRHFDLAYHKKSYGYTSQNHIIPTEQAVKRFKESRPPKEVSVFLSKASAQDLITKTLQTNEAKIIKWFHSTNPKKFKIILNYHTLGDKVIGYRATRINPNIFEEIRGGIKITLMKHTDGDIVMKTTVPKNFDEKSIKNHK